MTTKENYKKGSGNLRTLLDKIAKPIVLPRTSYSSGQFVGMQISPYRKVIWNLYPDNIIANITFKRSRKDGNLKTIIQYRYNSDYRGVLQYWKYRQDGCYTHESKNLGRQRRFVSPYLDRQRFEIEPRHE